MYTCTPRMACLAPVTGFSVASIRSTSFTGGGICARIIHTTATCPGPRAIGPRQYSHPPTSLYIGPAVIVLHPDNPTHAKALAFHPCVISLYLRRQHMHFAYRCSTLHRWRPRSSVSVITLFPFHTDIHPNTTQSFFYFISECCCKTKVV